MILADTSAWVEFDRATASGVDARMTALIADDSSLAVTEPVIVELLAGARSEEHEVSLRRLLARFTLLRFDGVSDFDAAARIYQRCRRTGITPRGMIDCMIAAVVWRHGATLLTYDVDLARVVGVLDVTLDAASIRPPA